MNQGHSHWIAFIIKVLWSYLILEAATGTQLAHVPLSPMAGGSEKTNNDLGASVMFLRGQCSDTSGMAAVGPNCPAVFTGERQAEGSQCRLRGGRLCSTQECSQQNRRNDSRVTWVFLPNFTLWACKVNFLKLFFEIVRRHCSYFQRIRLKPAAVCCFLDREEEQFLQVHPHDDTKTYSHLQTRFCSKTLFIREISCRTPGRLYRGL